MTVGDRVGDRDWWTVKGDLSPAGRAWAIEELLRSIEGRWFERGILAARTEEEAVRWARSNNGDRGCWHAAGRMRSCYKHIDVWYRDGTSGRISWLELVRYARADVRQMALAL